MSRFETVKICRSKNNTASLLARLAMCKDGVIAIEFAIVLPVLLIITIPTINVFYNIQANQKVHKATYSMADIVSLSLPISSTTKEKEVKNNSSYLTTERLVNMTTTIDEMLLPLTLKKGKGTLIISSIYKPADKTKPPVVAWQYYHSVYGDGFVFTAPQDAPDSIVGKAGGDAHLPQSFIDQMYGDEGLVTVELTYTYDPPLSIPTEVNIPTLHPWKIFSVQYYPARYGALRYITPHHSPANWPPAP